MAAHPTSSRPSRDEVGSSRRVLVVDDHLALRRGLTRLIESSSDRLGRCDVRTAATLAEAVEAVRDYRPTTIVLDADLAGEDGLTLMRHLRQATQVIVLTSHGDPGTRARAFEMGASAFVDKRESAGVLLGHLAAPMAA